MPTKGQIHRLTQRVEALASNHHRRIEVIGPDETQEQALERLGVRSGEGIVFIRTGVPRAASW